MGGGRRAVSGLLGNRAGVLVGGDDGSGLVDGLATNTACLIDGGDDDGTVGEGLSFGPISESTTPGSRHRSLNDEHTFHGSNQHRATLQSLNEYNPGRMRFLTSTCTWQMYWPTSGRGYGDDYYYSSYGLDVFAVEISGWTKESVVEV